MAERIVSGLTQVSGVCNLEICSWLKLMTAKASHVYLDFILNLWILTWATCSIYISKLVISLKMHVFLDNAIDNKGWSNINAQVEKHLFNQPGHRMSSLMYSCGALLTRAPYINVHLCDSHHRVTPLQGVGLKPCQSFGPPSFPNKAVRHHGTWDFFP